MSVQDDRTAGQEGEQPLTEKPEPGDEQKEKAADMMVAYEDRPTLVLPGSGGAISGTAVNDWLDEDGNPKYADGADSGVDQEQVEKDKALNVELKKLAAEENKGEKRPSSK
ncbi:hypothetical protein [Mycobacterium sp. Aquia_213]|uniref:hypothetical protein n=1 Tax=Mycobacterium sp. Aquia_213 TaxID=2991728 RepID=UPI0022706448|nr:hypothetical protein [Mycobacterium sp. Aquia_213]WAC93503.1 hypothetical protein LMQ14_10420 [Mycobacterium sp. Aquia_213]